MALIKCEECGEEISSEAEACPHCGYKEKKIGCLGIIGYLILGFFLIGLLGKYALDKDGITKTKTASSAVSPEQAAKNYFKTNSNDKTVTCGAVLDVTVKKDSASTKDYLVSCSSKDSYRIIQEHTNIWQGKPADKWITHGFKCSDLKGFTIKGWQDPKDWGITQENCAAP